MEELNATAGPRSVLVASVALVRANSDLLVPAVVAGILSPVPIVGPVGATIVLVGLTDAFARRTGRIERDAGLARRLLGVVGAVLIGTVVVALGLIVFVLPGIYALVECSLLVPAIMVGSKGPIGGLLESRKRARAHVLTVFVAMSMLAGPLVAFFVGLWRFDPGPVVGAGLGVVVIGPSLALCGAALVVMYESFEPTTIGHRARPQHSGDENDDGPAEQDPIAMIYD